MGAFPKINASVNTYLGQLANTHTHTQSLQTQIPQSLASSLPLYPFSTLVLMFAPSSTYASLYDEPAMDKPGSGMWPDKTRIFVGAHVVLCAGDSEPTRHSPL